MKQRRWPFPGANTPTDRARTIALAYRTLAGRDDLTHEERAAQIKQMDEVCQRLGETWVGSRLDTGEPRITRSEFAALAGVRPDTISSWQSRPPSWGPPPPRGVDGKYDRAEVIAYLLRKDIATSERRTA